MTQPTFVQIPIDLLRYVRSLNLSGTQYELWIYLWEKDPFGDRFVDIPNPEVIATELGVNSRTILRAAQRLTDAGLFDLQLETWKCRNTTTNLISGNNQRNRVRTKRSNCGQIDPNADNLIQKSPLGSNCPNQEPEVFISNGFEPLQTVQNVQTNQTLAVGEKALEASTSPSTPVTKSSTQLSVIQPPTQQQNKSDASDRKNEDRIPQDLINKLEELSIPLDDKVRNAIARHHISQAYGAVAHIERTWESIDNPRGVFLFQISRQPIEALGSRLPVRRASEWGYSLEDIKRMYPTDWENAARHFGLEVEV